MLDINLLMLCLKIFFARILDVSVGTARIMYVSQGKSLLAFICAFIEMSIWYNIVRVVIVGEENIFIGIAFALGFSCGTYIGSYITGKFSKGTMGVQVVLSSDNDDVVKSIRDNGFAVSVVNITSIENTTKYMLFIEVNKRKFKDLTNIINSLDNKAFIVANESKFTYNGYIK